MPNFFVKKLYHEVLLDITPTHEEKKREREVVARVLNELKPHQVDPILVGSTAKDTDLSEDKDIDVFIRFPPETDLPTLKLQGLKIGKQLFEKLGAEYEVDYAQHPYVKGTLDGFKVEIVPCYKGDKIKSSVDRTPQHTEYVKKRLQEKPHLKGDIRLLKRFMKAQNVYGAEEKVRGFSGYLLEVLVIYYGGFTETLKASSCWKTDEVIDPLSHWSDKKTLKYYFTNSDFIVIDPVDRDRNVAAAVSRQKLAEYIIHAREFLKNPSKKYFYPEKKQVKDGETLKKMLKSRGTFFIAFKFTHEKLGENPLYGQLRKTESAIQGAFEDEGFSVFKTSIQSDEENTSIVLVELSVWSLPRIKHHLGPPVDAETRHQMRFHQKYENENPYLKDGRWVVDTQRRYTHAREVAHKIMKEKAGFGKRFRQMKLEILCQEEVVAAGGCGWLKHLTQYL
ncbi:MAG: CCA tRNA nucleotidyltransferase [Candidatus Altiarchaeales archaeon]|nr:CCA tRNA nucleotidyltransferase [Candidatus Altiarchaeales archaeon]